MDKGWFTEYNQKKYEIGERFRHFRVLLGKSLEEMNQEGLDFLINYK